MKYVKISQKALLQPPFGAQVTAVRASWGGESWITAELQEGNEPWAWRFWETSVDFDPGQYEIVARAWDAAANTQPEFAQQIWNFKGYMNNSWHRIKVVAE